MPTGDFVPIPLTDLKQGEHALLLNIGCNRLFSTRMTSLGLTPGVALEMTLNYGYGPLVVTVRGTRVALGRREAKKTLVQRSAI